MKRAIALLLITSEVALGAPRKQAPKNAYELLEAKAANVESKNTTDGWASLISGGVLLAVSLPGFYLSEDLFARAVYSLGQTVGVAAIGYGSYQIFVDNEYTSFHRILKSTELSDTSRNELSAHFLRESAQRAKNQRIVRGATHGLTFGLNLTSALTTNENQLKTALLFIGGVNLLAALHALFAPSEEEKLHQSLIQTGFNGRDLTVGIKVRF